MGAGIFGEMQREFAESDNMGLAHFQNGENRVFRELLKDP